METGIDRGLTLHQRSKMKCKCKCVCALYTYIAHMCIIHNFFFEGRKVETLSPEGFHSLRDLRNKMTY